MTNYSYIGSELELFREAINWKAYYKHLIRNHIGDEVLEVGAGIGSTTKLLCKENQIRWVCLEPDPSLANKLKFFINRGSLPKECEVKIGTLVDINYKEQFDTIIYIDVLEHIKNDKTELEIATTRLKDNGKLIVLAPAHQWLFSPFDEAIGHYRRYDKRTLSVVIPNKFECVELKYLDSIGLIASLGNLLILKSKMPNKQQIAIWDKKMIPISRVLDPLLHYSLGKSLLGIWQKKI